jgi:cerevisin
LFFLLPSAVKMLNNNKLFIFTLLSFIYLSLSIQAASADGNVGPAQPELVDSDHYIVVFKPNVPSLKISNQIQKLKLHQVNHTTTKSYTSTTTSSSSNITITKSSSTNKTEYNTIGKFRWYSAQFHTQALENHFASANNDTSIDAVHYYVKDAKFSLQTFVQTNPPSWVNNYAILHILSNYVK